MTLLKTCATAAACSVIVLALGGASCDRPAPVVDSFCTLYPGPLLPLFGDNDIEKMPRRALEEIVSRDLTWKRRCQ